MVNGYSMAFGARFLKRFIDEHIKLPITTMWKSASKFAVDVEDGEIVAKMSESPEIIEN